MRGDRDVGDLLTYLEFETAQQVSRSRQAAQLRFIMQKLETGMKSMWEFEKEEIMGVFCKHLFCGQS